MQNYKNVLPIKLNNSSPSGDAKTSKFLPFIFTIQLEKLIRTLHEEKL